MLQKVPGCESRYFPFPTPIPIPKAPLCPATSFLDLRIEGLGENPPQLLLPIISKPQINPLFHKLLLRSVTPPCRPTERILLPRLSSFESVPVPTWPRRCRCRSASPWSRADGWWMRRAPGKTLAAAPPNSIWMGFGAGWRLL